MDHLLPHRDLLRHMDQTAGRCPEVRVQTVGHSGKGLPIRMYSFGKGPRNALWYGFPDPGEAIGGTVILELLIALTAGRHADLCGKFIWHLVPCINPDDQPADGKQLRTVMKTAGQEIDWLVMNPRPETKVLLDLAESLRPTFTYALHDEYHSGQLLPVYWPTSAVLPQALCDRARSDVLAAGLEVNQEFSHATMGPGFFLMSDEDEFERSTFCRLARHGLVAIMELPYTDDPATLIGLQMSYGLRCMSTLSDVAPSASSQV